MRINEATALADLFEVSVDALLGRIGARRTTRGMPPARCTTRWSKPRGRSSRSRPRCGPVGRAGGDPRTERVRPRLPVRLRGGLRPSSPTPGTRCDDALNPPEAKPFKRLARKMLIAQLQEEDSADDTQS